MASIGADWSGMSSELLLTIFESQHHALDNCAAACTCVCWRTAAVKSHIRSLHLHANSSSYNTNWRNFLRTRQSISGLKLTSQFHFWPAQLAKCIEQGCCLQHIPLGCTSLSVSRDFLGIPGCISHLTGLQHPQFNFTPKLPNWEPLPDLSFLKQLKHLELHQEEGCIIGRSTSDAFPKHGKLLALPVEHLGLKSMADTWSRLPSYCTALTTLEFISCNDVLYKFQLDRLRSLNFVKSTVWDNGGLITSLTRPTFLGVATQNG